MKKAYRVISLLTAALLTVLSLATIVSAGEVSGDNMFTNGNFSKKLKGWTDWSNVKGASFKYSAEEGCVEIKNTARVAASLFQYAGMEAGKSYVMTADAKFENVSSDGEGVMLAAACYDSKGNNIAEIKSLSQYGTSDGWKKLTFVFKIPDGAVNVNAGPRLWFSTGTVYFDNLTVTEMKKTEAVSATYELDVSTTANKFPVDMLGCEWDPKLLLQCNKNNGVTDADLDVIADYMDKLNIQNVRMMICPEWLEINNDNDDPAVINKDGFSLDNDEMKNVIAYLGVCERLGVKVTLTWWGAQANTWISCKNISSWIGAPNNLDEMSENVIFLLKYIFEDLKYTCVDRIIMQNEPSYSFVRDNGVLDFNYYVEMYKNLSARLKAEGFADKITLIGSDDSESLGWFCRSYDALKDICGGFNSHLYAWGWDSPLLDTSYQQYVSARTGYADAPFYMGEFGDGTSAGAYAAASTETYGRGLYMMSAAVNAFKAGASGLSYWPLHDVYYYQNDQGGDNGGLMSMGLIAFKENGTWRARPSYYSWGLICNHVPSGSVVYDITGENGDIIDAVATKKDDTYSVILVNRSTAAQTVKVKSSLFSCEMSKYIYTESALPDNGDMIAPSGTVISEDGVYTVEIPAASACVLKGEAKTDAVTTDTVNVETNPAATTDGTNSSGNEGVINPWAIAAIAAGALVIIGGIVLFAVKGKKNNG